MKIAYLLMRFMIALFSLGCGVYGCWTYAPGHELKSIFYVVLAIWLQPKGEAE